MSTPRLSTARTARALRNALGVAAVVLAAGACDRHATELFVVVDSDLRAPEEIDGVEIHIDAEGHAPQVHAVALGDVAGALGMPVTLGVVPGAEDVPMTITAVGVRLGLEVVHQAAYVRYVHGETREVRLHLVRACERNTTCPGDATCDVGGACTPLDRTSDALPAWPEPDASYLIGPECDCILSAVQTGLYCGSALQIEAARHNCQITYTAASGETTHVVAPETLYRCYMGAWSVERDCAHCIVQDAGTMDECGP